MPEILMMPSLDLMPVPSIMIPIPPLIPPHIPSVIIVIKIAVNILTPPHLPPIHLNVIRIAPVSPIPEISRHRPASKHPTQPERNHAPNQQSTHTHDKTPCGVRRSTQPSRTHRSIFQLLLQLRHTIKDTPSLPAGIPIPLAIPNPVLQKLIS